MSQIDAVHTIPSYLSKIYFNTRVVYPHTSVWTLAVLIEVYCDFSKSHQENFGVMLVHYRFLSNSLQSILHQSSAVRHIII
jgi:hypothetical protein